MLYVGCVVILHGSFEVFVALCFGRPNVVCVRGLTLIWST